MKKISILVMILIIFNFICMSFFSINVYADSDGTYSIDDYKKAADEGKTTITGTNGTVEQEISLGDSDTGSAGSYFGALITSLCSICVQSMSNLTNSGGLYHTESEFSAQNTGLFTINSLIFGEYLMFNSKAYEKASDLNSSVTPTNITETIDKMKETGMAFSHLVVSIGKMAALPMMLIALVRVVMATKADDLAAWKKILGRWVLCFALMFFFQYILIAIDAVCDTLIDSFWNIRVYLEGEEYRSFESIVELKLFDTLAKTGGITSFAYSIEFLALTVLQLLFLIKYAKRSFIIIILFIIAPVVILIHTLNLMLGKTNNILGSFFKSYIICQFMQPVHALFYMVFLVSLSEIAINVVPLGIILIYVLYRAEKIIEAMLGWELGSSILSLNK